MEVNYGGNVVNLWGRSPSEVNGVHVVGCGLCLNGVVGCIDVFCIDCCD